MSSNTKTFVRALLAALMVIAVVVIAVPSAPGAPAEANDTLGCTLVIFEGAIYDEYYGTPDIVVSGTTYVHEGSDCVYIYGTSANETIYASDSTQNYDYIVTGGGRDFVYALGGNDMVEGSRDGTPGLEIVYGGAGNDTIRTGMRAYGEDGNDEISALWIADGGNGNDVCWAASPYTRFANCETTY